MIEKPISDIFRSLREAGIEPPDKVAHFGVPGTAFELDFVREELRQNGEPVKIQGKPLRLLFLLLAYASMGLPVKSSVIEGHLWPDGHLPANVKGAIRTIVRKVREALGDKGKKPTYIKNIWGGSYRFVEEVRWKPPASALPTRVTPLRLRVEPLEDERPETGNRLLDRDFHEEVMMRLVDMDELRVIDGSLPEEISGTRDGSSSTLRLQTTIRPEGDRLRLVVRVMKGVESYLLRRPLLEEPEDSATLPARMARVVQEIVAGPLLDKARKDSII